VEIGFKEFDVEINGVEGVWVDNIHIVQTDDLVLAGYAGKEYIFMTPEVLEEFDFTQSTFGEDSFGEDVGDLRLMERV
jgi:hypothetical protein